MTDIRTTFDAGRAAWERNDLGAAETLLREALAAAPGNPTIRAALGSVLLKGGQLTEGFQMFDAWREAPGREDKVAPNLPFPQWRGQPVTGKRVLVWSEDGFGDQIMYARFARALMRNGATVSWLCPPQLAHLFETGLGVTALPSNQAVDLECDFYCPSSALPLGFNLTLQTIPRRPYIVAPPARATGARIGVMTRGNPNNVQGRNRALSPDLAARLLSLPGVIELSPEATGAADFRETAAIIAGLDLVISVDTAVAHLTGALGKPLWVMVPYVADWRWPSVSGENPWYPTARVFRQGEDRDWAPVVAEVERQAQALA